MYETKFVVIENLIKHFDKNIYFRDVDMFIDRMKNMIVVKNVELIHQNFYICFRDTIFAWYTSILIENQKRFVKLSDNVDEWVKVLHKRFKKLISIVMIIITRERYTMKNARRKRKSMKYVDIIIRAIKTINMIVFVQIYLIYNELNLEFRRDLSKSTKTIIMKIFLQNVKNNKKIWWNLKIKHRQINYENTFNFQTNRNVNNYRFNEQTNSYNNFNSNRQNQFDYDNSSNYDNQTSRQNQFFIFYIYQNRVYFS